MKKYLKFLCIMAAFLCMSLSGAFSPVRADLIPADIVWLIDVSGSMGNDINYVKNGIVEFNNAMVANGIDAFYGLVVFGSGGASNPPILSQNITDFATFNDSSGAFQQLSTANGYFEAGSEAILTGLTASFRQGSTKNLILLTDEDDDSDGDGYTSGTWPTRNSADVGLANADALFNFIGDSGYGNTDDTYGFLADNHGGAAFDIYNFRYDRDTFFTNFIDTKVQEIKESVEPVPESGTMLLLGAGLAGLAVACRRKKAYSRAPGVPARL